MTNFDFYKIYLVNSVVESTNNAKKELLNELAIHALDPVIKTQRFRTLYQLSQFESQIIEKIWRFEPDNLNELLLTALQGEIRAIVYRHD